MPLKKWLTFVGILSLVLVVDQTSKSWVLANMIPGETLLVIPSLHPYFQITFSMNTGAAFGILPSAGGLFLIAALFISAMILYYYIQSPVQAVLMHTGLALVLGGALGNVVDRLQHGYVVDFVHLSVPGVFSNVSNFADHAIVLGVLLLIVDMFWRERTRKQAQEPAPTAVD